MSGFEAQVRNALQGGQTVVYSGTPIYQGQNAIPRAVTMTAQGSGGFKLNVSILNNP
jgi:hypothetical protein